MKRSDEPFLLYLEDYTSKNIGFRIKFLDVVNFMKNNFDEFDESIFPKDDPEPGTENNPVIEPELNLFLWAVLSNRIEIAKIFWRLGKVRFEKIYFLFKVLICFL
jgi:hypothetical protein